MKFIITYTTLSFIIFFIPGVLFAQSENEFPAYDITIYGGAGIPLGDYSGNPNDQMGHALTGIAFGGEFIDHMIEFFDVDVAANAVFNAFDEDKFAQELGSGVKVSATHYTNISLEAGGGVNFPMTKNIKIYGHGYLGVTRSTSPEINATYQNLHASISSASSYTFSYSFKAGVTISPVDISISYHGATPTYKFNNFSGSETKIDQTISLIQLSIGYVIKLQ